MKISIGRTAKLLARLCLTTACALGLLAPAFADDSAQLVTTDHYVKVKSTAPAMAGQDALLYVREVAPAGTSAKRVVLFVHGLGIPASVSFDVPYKDYSWMAYLAKAGFDVFAVDLTGYGHSTHPQVMNDPCNLPQAQQAQFVPKLIPAPCPPTYTQPITTMASDWNDVGTVVDNLRDLRHVDKISIIAWSLGGARTIGFLVHNPEKVDRLVLLAPLYNRATPTDEPASLSYNNGAMTAQSQAEFVGGWNRQVSCPDQYDPAISDVFWSGVLASDPLGASWGPGVRRAPQVTAWGFNQAVASTVQTPVLLISGADDKSAPQESVKELYADFGSKQKVFVDLACSSHNAMLEKNHLLMFQASLEWLRDGKVNGSSEGMLKLGY